MNTEELYRYIGRMIRRHRIDRGWTQEELSRKADISLSFLGHIERGTRKLSVDTLYKLAFELECSIDELTGAQLFAFPDMRQKFISELNQLIVQLRILQGNL